MADHPRKIYLGEDQIPKQWYNIAADMPSKPDPILNPGTLKPVALEELSVVFCTELAKQELNTSDAFIDIPDEVREFY